MKQKKNTQLFGLYAFLIITLFVLYPQPTTLFVSIYRVFNPPIEPHLEEIAIFSERIKSDSPEQVEYFVKYLFPYQYDWKVYSVPWYFPTVEEALEKRRGDCKTRLLITASILEHRQEEYSFNASPTHVWVDYSGKKENSSENENVAFFSSREGERLRFPRVDAKRSSELFWQAFWGYMPKEKKASLLLGALFSSIFILFPNKLHYSLLDSTIKKE